MPRHRGDDRLAGLATARAAVEELLGDDLSHIRGPLKHAMAIVLTIGDRIGRQQAGPSCTKPKALRWECNGQGACSCTGPLAAGRLL